MVAIQKSVNLFFDTDFSPNLRRVSVAIFRFREGKARCVASVQTTSISAA